MTTTNKHQHTIESYATGLATLTTFLLKHNPPTSWSFTLDPAPCGTVHIWADTDKEKRDRILSESADTFGRDEWIAQACGATQYNWTKVIDGVTLQIYGAEYLPPLETRPVSPNKFPIQLECNPS